MRKQAWLAVAGILVAGVIGIAQSNEISNADEFEAAMKDVGKNFGAVRAAMEAREPDDVSSGAGQLVTIFEGVEAFFEARELKHGITVAGEAKQAATDIRSSRHSPGRATDWARPVVPATRSIESRSRKACTASRTACSPVSRGRRNTSSLV